MKRIITLALACLMVVVLMGLTACGTSSNSNGTSTKFDSMRNEPEITADDSEDKLPVNDYTANPPKEEEQNNTTMAEKLETAKQEYEDGKKVLDAAGQKYELAKREMELTEQRYENGEISNEEFFNAQEDFFDGPHKEYFAAQREFFDGPHRKYFDVQAEYFGR